MPEPLSNLVEVIPALFAEGWQSELVGNAVERRLIRVFVATLNVWVKA